MKIKIMTGDSSKDSKITKTIWGEKEKAAWLANQSVKRSYQHEVLAKIEALKGDFDVSQYGFLSYDPQRYPLFMLKTRNWNENNRNILITGGVHGYETSGVQGALRFLESAVLKYTDNFNFVVAPCVSPWGYETINRWDTAAIDPNRSFYANSPAESSAALMKKMADLNLDYTAHFDLHETTDTDNSVFMPALAQRDGTELVIWEIPDGFYLVGDTENPVDDFQTAIIHAVKKVTHIAPADEAGCIIGEPVTQNGVINYATKKLALCTGFSQSEFVTTTEVYPDSPKVTDEDCILAQVAAISGGLDYLLDIYPPDSKRKKVE